jgi:hypothetical protein
MGKLSIPNRFNKDGSWTSEYSTWVSIKQRCTNKKCPEFFRYGGRGINVSGEWMQSYDQFAKDMGSKPTRGHSIDRIDNDAGYNAGNCRWATWQQQTLNSRTRSDNKLGLRGIVLDKEKYRVKNYRVNIWIDKKQKMIGRYETLEEALSARLGAEVQYYGLSTY